MTIKRPIIVLCLWLGTASLGAAQRTQEQRLLRYRDREGISRGIKTQQDWQNRRVQIMKHMQDIMGKLPGKDRRVDLDVQVEEEVDMGSYVRQLVTYQSEPDSRTPAYLCLPKRALKASANVPAVLCLHPTDHKLGHKVAVGLGGRPGRQYAAELAERGYVTLSPAYPHLANYWPNLGRLGYVSGTMKAIWDNSRGLDLLASMPQVDSTKGFAAIGHSLGGHNGIFTAVFDERVTVLVSSCGFDSFLDYYGGDQSNWFFGKGWCQIRYMPRLSNYRERLDEIPFDFHELLGVLAPRRCYVSAPKRDNNFRWSSVDQCAAAAFPIYRLFDAEENLVIRHPDCDHDFPTENRLEAYQMIDAVLLSRASVDRPSVSSRKKRNE